MIAVIPHQCRQIERNRQPAAAMFQQVLVALVGLLRRREPRELPHREQLPSIPAGVNSARERRLPRIAQVLVIAPVFRQIRRRVQTPDRHIRNRAEPSIAVLVEIGSRWRANRLLWRFLQQGIQRLFRPLLLRFRRFPACADLIGCALLQLLAITQIFGRHKCGL